MSLLETLAPAIQTKLSDSFYLTAARKKQLPPLPNDWTTWLVLAGRGFGKTRLAVEWVNDLAMSSPAGTRIILAGRTAADVRGTMLYGESGLMNMAPADFRPRHIESKRLLIWPNGVMGETLSADNPDVFRGPQCHYAWVDELASWPDAEEAWQLLRMGMRLQPHDGTPPRACVTTTPRPTKLIIGLRKESSTRTVCGTTYENRSNLAAAFFADIISRYEGTRIGRQELLAEVLEDAAGALWKRSDIEDARCYTAPPLKRVVVAIDPAVTVSESSDETGIVVAGIDENDDGYVLADYSGKHTADQWAQLAVKLYEDFGADRIVAEVNNGGDLVERTLRTVDPNIAYTAVRASRGKHVRAEPVAALYEQKRVHHVGMLGELEDQLCSWDPMVSGKSPDRLDALVWALSNLMVKDEAPGRIDQVLVDF